MAPARCSLVIGRVSDVAYGCVKKRAIDRHVTIALRRTTPGSVLILPQPVRVRFLDPGGRLTVDGLAVRQRKPLPLTGGRFGEADAQAIAM